MSIAAVIVLVLFCLPIPSRSADMLRWVDDRGVIHFTDNLHNIPKKHRDSVQRIKSIAPLRPSVPPPYEPIYPDKTTIRLRMKGHTAVVEALLNGTIKSNLIVDTGASYTVISRSTAKKLGIDLHAKFPTASLQTANGIVSAPLISLDSIEVGGMKVDNLTAAVHDFSQDKSISGLLGLNFLSQFRMDIDPQKKALVLEKK